MVEAFFADYFERLESLHRGVEDAVAGLPAAALDWVPGPGMNSIAVLVVHLAGAERYWIGDMAGEDPSDRVRAAEFEVVALEADELISRLQETLRHSKEVLSKMTLADLGGERHTWDGKSFTAGWCLAPPLSIPLYIWGISRLAGSRGTGVTAHRYRPLTDILWDTRTITISIGKELAVQ